VNKRNCIKLLPVPVPADTAQFFLSRVSLDDVFLPVSLSVYPMPVLFRSGCTYKESFLTPGKVVRPNSIFEYKRRYKIQRQNPQWGC